MIDLNWKALAARSPLTDLRALSGAVVFHGLLVVLAWLVALSVTIPAALVRPRTLSGELDPVDNRAAAQDGGGSPGELGGEGLLAALPTSDGLAPGGATRDPAVDALLSE